MERSRIISIIVNRRKREIDSRFILYIIMRKKYADIYMNSGETIVTRMTYMQLCEMLGEDFVEIKRGCIVNCNAIHSIDNKVNLNNGVSLSYTSMAGRKKEISRYIQEQRKRIISQFKREGVPASQEEFGQYYRAFEFVPIAFTDIEMVFDTQCNATDWVFCYGNQALANLEKVPLEQLIGKRFGHVFPNMDEKWLRCYERVVLFGDTLGINDYSPEIDTDLIIICFPTFEGHCGCILADKDVMFPIVNAKEPLDLNKLLSEVIKAK